MYPHAVFDADAVIRRIERHRITFIPGPPTLFQSMLASSARATADISSLRTTIPGAASVPRQLIERMHTDLGFDTVLTAYGLTESNGTISMCSRSDPIEKIAATSGRPIPGVEVRCVDMQGRDVAAGQPGEILARGFNIMRGYLDDPAATAAAIDADGRAQNRRHRHHRRRRLWQNHRLLATCVYCRRLQLLSRRDRGVDARSSLQPLK